MCIRDSFESTIEYRELRAFAAREYEDDVGYRRPTGVDRRRQLVGHVERQSKQRVERGGRRDNDALGGGGFILRGVERELGLQDFEPWHVAVLEACLRRIADTLRQVALLAQDRQPGIGDQQVEIGPANVVSD